MWISKHYWIKEKKCTKNLNKILAHYVCKIMVRASSAFTKFNVFYFVGWKIECVFGCDFRGFGDRLWKLSFTVLRHAFAACKKKLQFHSFIQKDHHAFLNFWALAREAPQYIWCYILTRVEYSWWTLLDSVTHQVHVRCQPGQQEKKIKFGQLHTV